MSLSSEFANRQNKIPLSVLTEVAACMEMLCEANLHHRHLSYAESFRAAVAKDKFLACTKAVLDARHDEPLPEPAGEMTQSQYTAADTNHATELAYREAISHMPYLHAVHQ